MSNYATKSKVKKATCVDTLEIAEKVYLRRLKSEVDRLNIDEMKFAP